MLNSISTTNLSFDSPPAVVVGVCGHGLTLIRALAMGKIPIIALEANRDLPGVHTKFAAVRFIPDINGEPLIASLIELGRQITSPMKAVLFLTNDNMIRTIARHWEQISDYYSLSWAHCRMDILSLLDKNGLESRCLDRGLQYPASFLLSNDADIDAAIATVGSSAIIKPSKPLSGFKTYLPRDRDDYAKVVTKFRSDLPFLVQTFIPGDDSVIYFCALYLDHGKVIDRFDGRKLRSRPMGHTTVAEPFSSDEVFEKAMSFFSGNALSGPVSLELKRDPHGNYWVIEPTVGRTDFWLGLCVENGVNLPLEEYKHQIGANVTNAQQQNAAIWFNEERDPFGIIWLLFRSSVKFGNRRPVFLFLNWMDRLPALVFSASQVRKLFRSFLNRSTRVLGKFSRANT